MKKRVKSASSSDDEKIRVEMCVCGRRYERVCVCASFSISKGVLFIFFIFPFSFFSLHFRIQCYLSASSSSSPSSVFAASLLLCLCNPSSVSQCAFVVNFFVVFASLFSTFFLQSHCVSARCVCVCVCNLSCDKLDQPANVTYGNNLCHLKF